MDHFSRGFQFVFASLDIHARGNHIGRRERAGFDQSLIVRKLHVAIHQSFVFDFVIAARKDQIPIRALHLRDDFNGALPKLTVGHVQAFFGQLDRAATNVNVLVAQERLNEAEVQVGGDLRIQIIEWTLRGRTIVVERALKNRTVFVRHPLIVIRVADQAGCQACAKDAGDRRIVALIGERGAHGWIIKPL